MSGLVREIALGKIDASLSDIDFTQAGVLSFAGKPVLDFGSHEMDGTTLRDGIFALNTRRFGSVAEVMIQKLIHAAKAKSLFHDLYDDALKHRIEVKFSRVQIEFETKITAATVIECIKEAAVLSERMVPFSQWQSFKFDCNIQQIKLAEFDILFYGLFFKECVKIFRINQEEIANEIRYSDKQHKGNKGEGQFHITRKMLNLHIQNHLYASLSYDELYDHLK